MTGQEFIDALQRVLLERGKLSEEYTPADLTMDAAAVGLWYRKPSTYEEQEKEQKADLVAARAETAKLDKTGGHA
jgi:hypothetical protein